MVSATTATQRTSRTSRTGGAKPNIEASEEGVTIGIEAGPVTLGISTNYGPGVVVGLGPININWGTNGGKSETKIGPFTVTAEAKDCIVTVTKEISGVGVVERYTYRDPGCGPEPQPTPPPPPEPDDEEGLKGIDPVEKIAGIPDGVQIWVVMTKIMAGYPGYISGPINTWEKHDYLLCDGGVASSAGVGSWNVSGASLEKINGRFHFGCTISAKGSSFYSLSRTGTQNYSNSYTIPKGLLGSGYGHYAGLYPTITFWDLGGGAKLLRGQAQEVRQYVKASNHSESHVLNWTCNSSNQSGFYIVDGLQNDLWRYVKEDSYSFTHKWAIGWCDKEPPPKANKPKKGRNDMECCERSERLLREIHQVLDAKRFLAKKFKVSNRFMMAGGQGETSCNNYLEVLAALLKTTVHGSIFEPQVKIADANAAKEGNQNLHLKFTNATSWAQALTEMIVEIMDDGNVNENMGLRTGIHSTQLMVATLALERKLDAILDMLGGPLRLDVENVSTMYNLDIVPETPRKNNPPKPKGKGFDPNGKETSEPKAPGGKKISNDDAAIEALLPKFLSERKNPVKTVAFDHRVGQSLYEILTELRGAIPPTQGERHGI